MASAAAIITPAQRIDRNRSAFEQRVQRALAFFHKGQVESAAVEAALAAHVATSTHCGFFWSPRLEALLNRIGRELPDDGAFTRRTGAPFERVLHVCTEVHNSGGLTRMISRWVTADKDRARTNSLALTQHRGPLPAHLTAAIEASGGQIHRINRRPGTQFTWAQELRRIARQHDVIVLHIYCEDVVPLLAFAEPARFPPVLLLNHADHLFWFGPSISHAVINLRDAAGRISAFRRNIEPRRNLLLPTIVDAAVRLRSKGQARELLGLDPSRVVMVSVARATKYRTMDGVTYADLHVPVLQKHPDAELIVVGAASPEDWGPAIASVGGRITPLPNQADPRPYYEAADIYVDSYPFVSSTSMMEAAGYGLPPVTIFTADEAAEIFGINHVGLVGTARVARSISEYQGVLSGLISDAGLREKAGEAAREAINRLHVPPGWLEVLDDIYARAGALPPLDNRAMLADPQIETPNYGEPDSRHEDLFRSTYPMSGRIKGYMGMLPVRQHLAYWNEMRRARAFASSWEALSGLTPEWLRRNLKDGRPFSPSRMRRPAARGN